MAGVYICSDVCHEAFILLICYKNYLCSIKYVKAAHFSMGCCAEGARGSQENLRRRLHRDGARWQERGPQSGRAGARAAKREGRVVARGRSSSHATIRSTFIAAAMATCCIWVFGKPRYRVRRNPNARTPCESVPSTPACC